MENMARRIELESLTHNREEFQKDKIDLRETI